MELQIASIILYRESLGRLTNASPIFLDVFYHHFINDNEQIACLFHGRNVERIKRKLTTTLALVADNANGAPGTGMYLEMLGRIHERRHITAEHLIIWKEALLTAVAECDPAFNESVRSAWQEILDAVIEKMWDKDDIDSYPADLPVATTNSTRKKIPLRDIVNGW